MKQLTLLVLLYYCIAASAQQYDATWVMGYPNAVYKFDSSSIYMVDTFPLNNSLFYFISSGCMSDKNGNLIYISNGLQINDRNDNLMEGGDQLALAAFDTSDGGYDFAQNPLSLPMPGNDSLYYIFYESYWDTTFYEDSRLYYGIINMNENNGLGKIISLNNLLIDTLISDGGLSACKHANGTDWWLIKPKCHSNKYFEFLVKANGIIEGPFIQTIGLVSATPDYNAELVFSPAGDKMFYTNGMQKGGLFDFDRCTGTLSNPRYIWGVQNGAISGGYGAAFSPSGRFLYVTVDSFKIYQLDTYSPHIENTRILLFSADLDSNQFATYYQLAPNGKIYIEGYGSPTPLSVINYPDSFGFACGLDTFVYDTLPDITLGMPNFPYYRTPAAKAYQADAGNDTTICLGDTVILGVPAVENVVYQWYSSIGLLNDTDIAQPLATPTQTTTYYLTITDTVPNGYSCNVRTDSITVHVVPLPCLLSVADINKEVVSMQVFPNPAGNAVNIGYNLNDDNQAATLQLSNILGQTIYSKSLPGKSGIQQIDMAQFATGMYTVYIKCNSAVVATGKLVVVH